MSQATNGADAPTIPQVGPTEAESDQRRALSRLLTELRRDTLSFARAMFAAMGDEAALASAELLFLELLDGVAAAAEASRALAGRADLTYAGSEAAASALAALELAETGIQMIVSTGFGSAAVA